MSTGWSTKSWNPTGVDRCSQPPIAVDACPLQVRVRRLDPDVLLSVVCGQRIGPSLRAVPEHAINLHGSLLPKYRGRATAFWLLYYGDDESGVTAHLLTDDWDAGPIVDRATFPLRPGDTVHDVYARIAAVGAELAIDVLDSAEGGTLTTRPNPTTGDEYHSLPSLAERREFHGWGNRIV